MKRVLSIFAILVLISSVSFAQLGLKAGLSFANVGGDDAKFGTITPTVRTGFVAGASYKIGLLMGLSIEPEVLYVQKGFQVSVPGISGKFTGKYDYLDIPVLVKFAPLPLPVVKPYLEAGVSYGILMSAKDDDQTTTPGTTTDVKDALNKNDVSIIIGAGADVSLLVISFTVDVRYVLGQTKLIKAVGTAPEAKVYNRGVQATVGINL